MNKLLGDFKHSLLNIPLSDWPSFIEELGEKAFRANQLAEWVFQKRAKSFSQMSNLPQSLREKLEKGHRFRSLVIKSVKKSKLDGTARYFFETAEGETVSCVVLPHEQRRSLCISSQLGCGWGCVFCASGLVPFKRNLSPAEILDQILLVEEVTGESLDSILFMGMGEPLGNYRSLIKALNIIRSPVGLNFGARHVTVSTCGLVPQIESLANDAPKVNLAVSLHSARDEVRRKLLPKSSKWSIKELLQAVKSYSKRTKTRVTFEYIILDGINDSEQDAKRLANLLRGVAQHGDYWVNLISYNPVPGLPYRKPKEEK
ncbi:23S rRNA (adenine(2503)-C(2))-methyltransferase, partial [bacterium F11]